jgi:hypothetical protein
MMTGLVERRCLMGLAVAAYAATVTESSPEAQAAPAGIIRVTPQGGAPIPYNLATAKDAGSFHGPGFVQHCFVLPRSAALPSLAVIYRPDADGRRHEVVLELSDAAARQAADMAGYDVALEIGGRVVLSGSTPRHWWAARWRLQTAPRPQLRTIESITRAGLVPGYQAFGTANGRNRPYEPMGMAGVEPGMSMTGGRNDIGLFPAWTTEFLATGSDTAWRLVAANAEACASVPWHWRDETGQIFNIDRHPDWAIDSRFAPSDKVPASSTTRDPTKANPEDAHQPQLTYVPYLITGDPYFLEELQFQASWHMWSHSSYNGLGLVINSQVRGLAWTLRQIALAAAVTPEQVPSWLLPREYFLRKLENNRRWFVEQTTENIDPVAQTFHFPWVADLTYVGSWQEDFNSLVLGQIVRMGFTAWRPIYDWCCSNLLARGNGTSGWPRQAPVWYFIGMLGPDGIPATSWAALAQVNDAILKKPVSSDYLGIYLAALRMAASLGNRDALPILNWYESQGLPQPKTQKYLNSPDPAPAVPPQPASPGDPQYRPALQRLPRQPGSYPLAAGATQIVAGGPGQTLTIGSGQGIWRAMPYGQRVVAFFNTSAGGKFTVKDVQSVAFTDNSFNVTTGQWTTARPR